MKWLIYKHTNKINGKVYIGQTCQSALSRFQNGKGYKKCPVFNNAIKKYGWENFKWEFLEENMPTKELANKRETYYINLYRSYIGFEDCNGYNMTLGGDYARFSPVWTEENIELFKQLYPIKGGNCYKDIPGATKSSVQGLAHRLQIKSNNKININWSEQEIQDLKSSSNIVEAESKISHPRSSIYRKAKELGISLDDIRKKSFSPEDIETLKQCKTLDEACRKICVKEDTKENRRAIDHKAKRLGIILENYKTKKWTEDTTLLACQAHSVKEAVELTGFCRSIVLQKKKEFGFTFLPYINSKMDKSVQVVRYATQEINTANYFIKTYNIPKCSFYKMLKNPTLTVKINGKEEHFCLLDDLKTFKPLPKKGHPAAKAVKCNYDGAEYESSYEAARQVKEKYGIRVPGEQISRCCKRKCKTAGGYHWKYVNDDIDNNKN